MGTLAYTSAEPLYTGSKWYTVALTDAEKTAEAVTYLSNLNTFSKVDFDYVMGVSTSGEAQVNGIPVEHIGWYAFRYTSVQTVHLPNTIQTIDDYAFMQCDLTQITLPDSLTTIEQWGFFNVDMTSIIIPENVTQIQHSTFCHQLLLHHQLHPRRERDLVLLDGSGL